MTTVSGEMAAAFDAIRLDSFSTVNEGKLIEADENTGKVAWKDKADELKTVILGERAIKIIPRAKR